GEIDVEHGADADKAGEAKVFRAGPVENGRADGPRLAQERDAARFGHTGGKRGIEVRGRMDDAEAVGPDDAHLATGDVTDPPFEFSPLGAQLREPGRDDDGRADALPDALLDDGRHRGRGRGDDGQVHYLGQRGNVLVAAHAVDGMAFGIDRVDDSAEGIFKKVAYEDAADRPRRGTGPDD